MSAWRGCPAARISATHSRIFASRARRAASTFGSTAAGCGCCGAGAPPRMAAPLCGVATGAAAWGTAAGAGAAAGSGAGAPGWGVVSRKGFVTNNFSANQFGPLIGRSTHFLSQGARRRNRLAKCGVPRPRSIPGHAPFDRRTRSHDCPGCCDHVAVADRTRPRIRIRIAHNGVSHNLRGCNCLLYTSPSPRDLSTSRMPSSA